MGKLSEADVQAIRRQDASGASVALLAARYGMSTHTMRMVVLGHSYRDVPWLPGTAPHKPQQLRGSKCWSAKLCEADVVAIRQLHAAGSTQRALATRYRVTLNTINLIVRRLTWRHVP